MNTGKMKLKILLIANYFPPANTVASHRIYSFARYLPEYGIDVDVVTPEREGDLNYDLSNMDIINPYNDISKVNKFAENRKIFKEIVKSTGIRPILEYFYSKFYKKARRLFSENKMKKYDAVFVSFGPANVLRLGFYLNRKYKIPLILDFRDIWTEILSFYPKSLDRLFIYFIERKIIKAASLVIATSKNNSYKIAKKHNANVITIYNGFFDDIITKSDFSLPDSDSSYLKIAYCGSLYNGVQPIEMLFPVLEKNENIKLHIAVLDEIDSLYIRKLIEKYGIEEKVNLYHKLSNNDSIQLQKFCDILLFLNRIDGSYNGIIAVKFFEYLKARKFILGIGHKDDEAGQIIEQLGIGAYATKVEEVQTIISNKLYAKKLPETNIAFFSRRNQAKILAKNIKKIFHN